MLHEEVSLTNLSIFPSHVPVQSGLPDGFYSGPCTQCGHKITFTMPLASTVSLTINGKHYNGK